MLFFLNIPFQAVMSFTLLYSTAIWHRLSVGRPTNDILIEFEIRPKFAVLCLKLYSTDHN